MSKTIKFVLSEEQTAELDRQATTKGVTRSDFIRSRVFASDEPPSFTAADLAALISRVHRGSNCPRNEVERIVYAVFTAVMSESREAASPVL